MSASAPGQGPRTGRRPAYVVEICISPQLRTRNPWRPLSLLEALGPDARDSGQRQHSGAVPSDHLEPARGQDQATGATEPVRAVRSVACTCTAQPGTPCSPAGDHLARYLHAEQRHAITRQTLTRVIAGLDIITPDVIIRPPGAATPLAKGRAAGRVIRPGLAAGMTAGPAQAPARTVPGVASRQAPELEAGT
jgi:hypothetical protein